MANLSVNLEQMVSGDNLGDYCLDPKKKPPFNLYIFPNLLDTKDKDQLRDALNSSVRLKPKDNDLYKFKQSKDLKTQIQAKKLPQIIHQFVELMLNKIREHLEKVTGKKLSDKSFDITASRYDLGNYLLCHNDDIKDNLKSQGRSLAFIYYLNSRDWKPDDGGALILYDSDSTGEPISINNQISPKPNTLVVFDTTSTSWHSVGEVLCKDDVRLSINGWFHSERPPTKSTLAQTDLEKFTIEPCPYDLVRPISLDGRLEKFFSECLNQDYLMEKTCFMIRKRFKRKSEINLTNFLVKEKFQAISAALKEATKDESNLEHVGPYNKRNYKVLKQDKLPQVCKDLFDAFRSDLFFMLLSRLTGLDLIPPSIRGSSDSKEETKVRKTSEISGDQNVKSQSEESSDSDEDEDDDDDDESDDGDDSDANLEDSDGDDDSDNEVDPKKLSETAEEEDCIRTKKPKIESEPTTSKENLESIKKEDYLMKKKKKSFHSDPLARLQFRHLEHGSYSLIHDYGFELGEKSALDVILHFNHDFGVNFDDGGYISYIDGAPEDDLHDMDCELLTVEPKSNCLSLVYRCDEGTCRFLKHISHRHKDKYQDLYCVYYERPEDLPNLGSNKQICSSD